MGLESQHAATVLTFKKPITIPQNDTPISFARRELGRRDNQLQNFNLLVKNNPSGETLHIPVDPKTSDELKLAHQFFQAGGSVIGVEFEKFPALE